MYLLKRVLCSTPGQAGVELTDSFVREKMALCYVLG